MKKTMFLLLLAALPVACQPAQTSEQCEKEAAKPVAPTACEFHFVAGTDRAIFQYTPDVPAPTGETCKSLGGGVYDCPDTFCNVVLYSGNCPECPGGGE